MRSYEISSLLSPNSGDLLEQNWAISKCFGYLCKKGSYDLGEDRKAVLLSIPFPTCKASWTHLSSSSPSYNTMHLWWLLCTTWLIKILTCVKRLGRGATRSYSSLSSKLLSNSSHLLSELKARVVAMYCLFNSGRGGSTTTSAPPTQQQSRCRASMPAHRILQHEVLGCSYLLDDY
ncbi:hypothetical protein EON65_37820 [archaeon]|nr:MAG: hypothetical protein EON65_37820 [archaeon]